MTDKGSLFILSGPSGVGKTTVEDKLKDELDLFISTSETTRPMRAGEVDGVDYIYRSEDDFKEGIEEECYLEWANVHGNLYGTPLEPIEEKTRNGTDCLLVIDVQGARQVRNKLPSSILIFLLPPSMEELSRRLTNRSTDDEETTRHRLKNARVEIDSSLIYDYSVVNHNIEQAVADVARIIDNCHSRRLHDRPSKN